MKRIAAVCVLMSMCLVWAGCDSVDPPPVNSTNANTNTKTAQSPPAPVQPEPDADPALPPAPPEIPMPVETPPPVETPAPIEPVPALPAPKMGNEGLQMHTTPAAGLNVVQEKANIGSGKGNYSGPRIITVPLASYWRAQDRMDLNRIVYSLKLYIAEHGRPPKTHEEFMEKIFKPLRIQLPELDEGERYIYVPEKVNLPDHTGLMVERTVEQ
ncbi:MAG: hypothetical protein JW818_13510 [Pirellulales bacterium]|nr:hypothetical protein [Pirellulales bacterium]